MLFKAGLNSLNGQCIYIKITGTPVIESHQTSDSGEDKNMIVSVHSYAIIHYDYVIFATRNQMVWLVVTRVPLHLKVSKTHHHHHCQLKLVEKRKA